MSGFLVAAFGKTGPVLAVVIALCAGWIAGYGIAKRDAAALCRASSLEVELSDVRQQLAIAQSVNDAAQERAIADEHAMIELEDKLRGYEDDFATGDTACDVLSADDARRLRDIR